MASKEASASLTAEEDHDQSGPVAPWQKAWLAQHRDKLIRRVPTMDVVDQLIPRRAMDIDMDVYQRIRACHEELRNDRARLLLDYVASHTQKIFWDFQEALTLVSCGDLAVRREDAGELAESFSAMELRRSAAAAPCRLKKPRPASVDHVIEELKSRYRKRKVPSLDGQIPRKAVSLEEIRVNICLLSGEDLNAMCGCGGQRQPFQMSSLESMEDSVVELEDLFNENENGEVPRMQVASGIAGSGKTMAFTLKATYEWAKKGRRRPFWENITMYFEGSLTDLDWWNAENIAEVFGLPHHDLTMQEEKEVVRYICSHASEVLLVADSMDEADVKVDSFLWRVLTGNCKAVEGLKVIICSRPCEKTSWLARTYLFDRHLEVVGFNEEKIGQFIETYFGPGSAKAGDLQAQLSSRPDVRSLMHTPLLATMICRRFDTNTIDTALPSNQTEVYEEAVIAMVHQSAPQDSGKVPSSILAELSPPHLHVAVVNLSQLAYSALAKKHMVFTRSELEEGSCLGHAVQLGFLSLSPGANITGRGQDVYSFPHHTMMEFFAAVHAVRQLIGTGEKTIDDLVSELGVDGDLSRFWVFVSGLLVDEQCETLLGALAKQVDKRVSFAEISRRRVLVIECYSECDRKLKEPRSAAISNLITSKGIALQYSHLSVSQAHAVSRVILQHRAKLSIVNCSFASMNTGCWALILASLQECSNLRDLYLPESAFAPETVDRVTRVIEKNIKSLQSLLMPVTNNCFPVSSAVMSRVRLRDLSVGSQTLTNEGSQLIVNLLRCQRLTSFRLIGRFNDDGFAPIASVLCSRRLAENLTHLALHRMDLSPVMISSTVSSLTNLLQLGLYSAPIGDAGLRQIAQHLVRLRSIIFHNIGLTPLAIPVLDMIIRQMPVNAFLEVAVQRSVFKPADQVIADIVQTTSWTLVGRESFRMPLAIPGLQIQENIKFFQTGKGQLLYFLM